MKVIGLTGGIASGKSAISSYLQQLGAHIIDADKVAREVVKPRSKTWQRLVDTFGSGIINEGGTINRKVLGDKVFSNPESMAKLNAITHPEIVNEIEREVRTYKEGRKAARLVVVDAPLLIEVGLYEFVDEVWVVYVDYDNQVKRLMNRDHISAEQAQLRIKSQMPLKDKLKYAGKVVDNNGPLEETYAQVKALIEEII